MASNNKAFQDKIKVNPENSLNPKVCQGDNLVLNILKKLGASNAVCQNPSAIDAIKTQFVGITNQCGCKMPNQFEQPTREQIESIVKAVETNPVLSRDERKLKYKEGLNITQRLYHGLTIDKETGSVTLGSLALNKKEYIEDKFAPDGKGNVVSTRSYSTIAHDNTEWLCDNSRMLLNSNGIPLENEIHFYEQHNGQNKLTYHKIVSRDPEYPFVVKEQTLVDDNKDPGTSYIVIDDLCQLDIPTCRIDENGQIKPIRFDTKEQVLDYCKSHKEHIKTLFSQKTNQQLSKMPPTEQQLYGTLYKGIEKLGIDAGTLEKE